MKIFLVVAFLFQAFCSSYCHAVYLLSRDGSPLEFEEWRTTQESIHRQVWVQEKSQNELTLPGGVVPFFVPDSLMQAFALDRLHKMLRADVQKQLEGINIDDGYINSEDIPFKFIHSEYEASGDREINEKVTEVFEKKQKDILKNYFPKRRLDESFIDIINQTPPEFSSDSSEPSSDSVGCLSCITSFCAPCFSNKNGKNDDSLDAKNWTPPVLEDAITYFLDQNFIENQSATFRLKAQHKLENLFFQAYQKKIKSGKWMAILNSFYPPINTSREKSPHFINVSHGALSYVMKRFSEDHENLSKAIKFEAKCEKNNTIALLRGNGSRDSRGTDEQHSKSDRLASISFGRGHYSGIFRDAHASIAYRSSKHKYFVGLAAPKQIFTNLMIIPPLSWYQCLGLGGELWHPRTTVAISTPLGERSEERQIEGVNLLQPIDKLGILIIEEDTQSHFQKVLEILKNSKILKENSCL